MATAQQASTNAPDRLNWRLIGLGTVAAVLARVLSSAFGSSTLATNIYTVILPLITAFLTVPVPRKIDRSGRIALVLIFAGLVAVCRRVLTTVSKKPRVPPAKPQEQGVAGGESSACHNAGPDTVQLTPAWLGQITATTAISLAPVAIGVAVQQSVQHRDTATAPPTVSGPTVARGGPNASHLNASDPSHRSGPATRRPKHTADKIPPVITPHDPIKKRARSERGTRVNYRVSATDDRDGVLTPSCRPASGKVFKVGITSVRCAAHDRAGNDAKPQIFAVIITSKPPAKDHAQTPGPTAPRAPNTSTTTTPPPPLPGTLGPSPVLPSGDPSPEVLTGNWKFTLKRDNFGTPEPQPYVITLRPSTDSRCLEPAESCYAGTWYNLQALNAQDRLGRPEGEFIVSMSNSGANIRGFTPDTNGTQEYTGKREQVEKLRYDGDFRQEEPSGKINKATFVLIRCSTDTPPDPPPGC
jgi:hypothetical protein